MKDTQVEMDRTEEVLVTDNNCTTKADTYSFSIELSNACREFYQTRKLAADAVKEKLVISGRQKSTKQKTSMELAMDTLRTEMTSLMDQDLSLMKQLLMLNEAIEDLKWQKSYYHSQSSVPNSSCNLSGSDLSFSETDMFEPEHDILQNCLTSSSHHLEPQNKELLLTSSDKLNLMHISSNESGTRPQIKTAPRDVPTRLTAVQNTNACHDEENSFDSGIQECVLHDQVTVV